MGLKTRHFSCIDMKDKCQEKVAEEIRGMTPTQELAHWNRLHRDLVRRQKALRSKSKV